MGRVQVELDCRVAQIKGVLSRIVAIAALCDGQRNDFSLGRGQGVDHDLAVVLQVGGLDDAADDPGVKRIVVAYQQGIQVVLGCQGMRDGGVAQADAEYAPLGLAAPHAVVGVDCRSDERRVGKEVV